MIVSGRGASRFCTNFTLRLTHAPTSNQWNPTTPVLIPSKAIFAELCIMQVVTGYLLRATEEDQAQQLKVFGGLGGLP